MNKRRVAFHQSNVFAVVFMAISLIFSFTSCENFLKGEDIKNEITKAIDYNNAPSYSIQVDALDGGSIKIPANGEIQKKVTDVFTVKFEPKSDHKFIKWEAVVRNMKAGERVSDYIEFEDAESLETKVTFKKASSSIIIRPVCPEKLTVNFNLDDSEKEYERNKSIELSFNKPIAADGINKITVEIPKLPDDVVLVAPDISLDADEIGNIDSTEPLDDTITNNENGGETENPDSEGTETTVDVDVDDDDGEQENPSETELINPDDTEDPETTEDPEETEEPEPEPEEPSEPDLYTSIYFQRPVLNERRDKISILPNTDSEENGGLIPVEQGKSLKVNVIIPANTIYYINNDYSEPYKIYLDSEEIKSYTVNSETLNKAEIRFTLEDDNAGSLKVDDVLQTGQKLSYSVGKLITLKYTPKADYTFCGWEFSRTFTDEDGVEKTVVYPVNQIENINLSIDYEEGTEANYGYDSSKGYALAKVTVMDSIDGVIKIQPLCYQSLSVSKFSLDDPGKIYACDSEIKLTFNKNIAAECAREISLIIPGVEGASSYYKEASLNKNVVTLTPDLSKGYIPVPQNATRTVTVTIPANKIYYTTSDGNIKVYITSDISYTYTINSETANKTKIEYVVSDSNGILKVDDSSRDNQSVEYSVGKTVSLKYTPKSGYTFCCWNVTRTYKGTDGKDKTDTIALTEAALAAINLTKTVEDGADANGYDSSKGYAQLQLTVNNSISGTVKIQPLCYESLTVTDFNLNDVETIYERDSEIKFTFKQNVFVQDSNNVTIKIPGIEGAGTYFKAATINGKVFTITPNLSKGYIPVAQNATRTVTVTIPAGKVYYRTENNTKIYNSSDITYTYTINSETVNKTAIEYVISDTNGVLKVDDATRDNQRVNYSVGKTISLKYTPKANYTFCGWEITRSYTGANGAAATDTIALTEEALAEINLSAAVETGADANGYDASKGYAQLQLTVNNSISGTVKIQPLCYESLLLTDFNLDDVEKIYERDSEIKFTFKQDVVAQDSNNVTIKIPGIEGAGTYFKAATINGKVFTISPNLSKGYIPVAQNATRTVTVTIPAGKIYYLTDDNTKIYNSSDITYTYTINSETVNKTTIEYVISDTNGVLKVDDATRDNQRVNYSVGKTISLKYTPKANFTFCGWEITRTYTNTSGATVTDSIALTEDALAAINLSATVETGADSNGFDASKGYAQLQLTVNNSIAGTVKIQPLCYESLAVSSFNLDDAETIYERDNDVKFTFNKSIASEDLSQISIKVLGISGAENYFANPSITNNILTIASSGYIPVTQNATRTVTVTIPAGNIYYTITDKNVKVKNSSDIVYTYTIDSETIKKTKIKAFVDDNYTSAGQLRVNNEAPDDRAVEYSVGKTIILKYRLALSEDYTFNGWSITKTSGTGGTQTTTFANNDFTAENLETFNLGLDYEDITDPSQITLTVNSPIDGELSIKPVIAPIQKTKIKFLVDDDYSYTGEFKIDGIVATGSEQEIRPGKSVNLRFRLTNEDYYFKGWSVKYKETPEDTDYVTYSQNTFTTDNLETIGLSVAYDDNEASYGYESVTKLAQATITVDEYFDKTLEVSPVIVPIPAAYVTIDGSNGKFSPAIGTYRIKEKIFDSLTFEPDGGYEFLRWQIYDAETGEEFNNADYITIKDLKAERTSFAVVRVPDAPTNEDETEIKLTIRPVLTERPQVLSYSPMYQAEGALKDSSIQVMFDYNMDEESIYYTDAELDTLIETLGMNEDDYAPETSPNKLLSFMKGGRRRYYGYTDENGTYFKNISIKNNKDEANLNRYFIEPSFDTPRTLTIKTNPSNPLPAYTQVVVTIDGDFFYLKDNKKISMNGSKKWVYQVSNRTDSESPEILDVDENNNPLQNPFKLSGITRHGGEWEEWLVNPENTRTRPTVALSTGGMSNFTFIQRNDNQVLINLEGTIVDGDGGMASTFTLKYRHLYTAGYQAANDYDTIYSYVVDYASVMGLSANLPSNIDISGLQGNGGLYEMWFEFKDLSGHTITYPPTASGQTTPTQKYYLAFESTAPSVKNLLVSDAGKEKNLDITWQEADYNWGIDLYKMFVRYHADNSLVYEALPEINLTQLSSTQITNRLCSLTNLDSSQHYSIDVVIEDYAGNQRTYNLDDFTTPSIPADVILPSEGPFEDSFTLEYELADLKYNETRVYYREKDSDDEWTLLTNDEIDGYLYCDIDGLNYGAQYEFEVRTYVEYGTDENDDVIAKESPAYKVSGALPVYYTRPLAVYPYLLESYDPTTIRCRYYTPNSAFTGIKILYSLNPQFKNAETKAEYDALYGPDSENYNENTYDPNYVQETWSASIDDAPSGINAYGIWYQDYLKQGTEYYIKYISYYLSEDNYTETSGNVGYTKTASVTNLACSAVTNSSFTATWAKPAGNYSCYIIQYKESTASSYGSEIIIDDKDATSYTVEGLDAGKSYNFSICAQVGDDSVRRSSFVSNSSPWLILPNPVTDFRVVKEDSSHVRVYWTKPEGNYARIMLVRSTNENFTGTVSQTFEYNDTTTEKQYEVGAGLTYYFKITTIVSNSAATPQVQYGYSDVICCSLAIDPVASRSVTVNSATQVTVSWVNPNMSVDGIRIYRSDQTDPVYTSTTQKTANASYSWEDKTVLPNHQYTYSIQTYKTVSGEEKTASLSVGTVRTKPAAVSNVGATTYNPMPYKNFYVYWTNPSDTSYWNDVRLYSVSASATTATNSTTTYIGTITDHSTSQYYFSDMTPGTTYRYAIRTTNDNIIYSDYSNIFSVTTTLQPASNFITTPSDITPTSMTCSWVNPAGSYTLKLQYKLDSGSNWTTYATFESSILTPNATKTYTISDLTPGNRYNARIVVSKSGFTDVTTPIKTNLTSYSSSDGFFYTRPAAPTLTYSSRTENSIKYTITKPSSGIYDGYFLYYKKSSASSYSGPITLAGGTTSYTLSNLESGVVYKAYLTAVPVGYSTGSSVYESSKSSEITNITTPTLNTVTNLVAHAYNGDVMLTWTHASGVHNEYKVQYKKSSDSDDAWETKYVSSSYNYKSLAGLGLERNVSYDFRVASNYYNSSYGIDYPSAFCTTVTFKTPPVPLANMTLKCDDGMGVVTLNCTAPSSTGVSVDFFVDDVYVGYTSFSAGTTGTKVVTIPNYTRGNSYTIKGRSYIGQRGNEYGSPSWASYYQNETYGAPCTYTYINSSGNITINGTTYSYSSLANVATSSVTIGKDISTNGSFTAGNSITLTKYSIGKYNVTQQLFETVMGINPSTTQKNYAPVTSISWYDAIAFCNKLSALLGLEPCYTIGSIANSSWSTFTYDQVPTSSNADWNNATCDFSKNGYHLPTEYQWEFAARGGYKTFSGSAITDSTKWNYTYSGSSTLGDVGWYSGNCSSIQNVGTKTSNVLGIYDMSGNVWELTNDWASNSVPAVTSTNFTVTYDSSYRSNSNIIYKGGAWCSSAYTIAFRLNNCVATRKAYDVGFRICQNKVYQ